MEVEQAIFERLKAMYEADTGTGGLASTAAGNNARVHAFVLRDDPQRTTPGPAPRIEVGIVTRDISPQGDPGDAGEDVAGKLVMDSVVAMHMVCHRDLSASQRNAILSRMRTVYWRRTPASASGWSHSRLSRLSGGSGPPGETTTQYIVRYRLVSTYSTPE